MNTRDAIVGVIAALIAAALLAGGVASCSKLVTDSRDRNQDKVNACLHSGFGGAVELNDGVSWVCTGGRVNQ